MVLVDQLMPGMDGLELSQTITSAPPLKDLAVLMLTPVAPPSEESLRQSGIRRCLPKPVRQAELYDCILGLRNGGGDALEAVPAEAGSAKTNLSRAMILLVEDNPINQDVVRCMLENLDGHVEVADGGPEALDLLDRRAYDLILMDCQMPVMDGYEVTRTIRRREKTGSREREKTGSPNGDTPRIPIIAMTANAMKGDRERWLAAGTDDYLSKPFRPAQLYDCLERWLPDTAWSSEPVSGAHHPAILRPETTGESRIGAGLGASVSTAAAAASSAPIAVPSMVAASPPAPTPIDRSALDQLRQIEEGGAEALIDRVLRDYFSSSPELIENLRRVFEAGDLEAMRDAAHTLKSTSAHLGAVKLASLAKKPGDHGPQEEHRQGRGAHCRPPARVRPRQARPRARVLLRAGEPTIGAVEAGNFRVFPP